MKQTSWTEGSHPEKDLLVRKRILIKSVWFFMGSLEAEASYKTKFRR